jgi:hypothetical protein
MRDWGSLRAASHFFQRKGSGRAYAVQYQNFSVAASFLHTLLWPAQECRALYVSRWCGTGCGNVCRHWCRLEPQRSLRFAYSNFVSERLTARGIHRRRSSSRRTRRRNGPNSITKILSGRARNPASPPLLLADGQGKTRLSICSREWHTLRPAYPYYCAYSVCSPGTPIRPDDEGLDQSIETLHGALRMYNPDCSSC